MSPIAKTIFTTLQGINAQRTAIVYDSAKYFKSRSSTTGFEHNWHERFLSHEQISTDKPVTKKAIVDNKNGEPKTAPSATSSPTEISISKKTAPIIATRGTIVSGNAVPIAANIPPIALSAIPYFLPQYSMEFVNNTHA